MFLFNALVYTHLLLSKVKNKYFLLVSFIILFILLGYRDVSVGTDTIQYFSNFQKTIRGEDLTHELLWQVVNKAVITLNGGFEEVLIISAILTLAPIYIIFSKKSLYPLLSVFLYLTFYFYFYSFNIIRQSIAMSFALYSVAMFFEKRTQNFILSFLIAFLFHSSAAIILPAIFMVYLFNKNNITQIKLILLQIVTLLIGLFFYDYLASFVLKYIYKDYELDEFFSVFGNFIYASLLNLLLLFITNITKEKNNWYYIFVVYVLFSNVVVLIPYASRFSASLGITATLFLPSLLKNNRLKKEHNFIVFILIVIYSMLSFYRYVGNGGVLPYQNTLF